MPEQREYLRHDLTALYAFIDSIIGSCLSRSPSAAYTPAADRFFVFVLDLATICKEHIANWSVEDDEEFEDRREELGTIRAARRELRKLIKPVLDADTLHFPSAVVDGIVRRFREAPKFAQTEFAIFHTAEFNYVQIRTADLRRVAAKIRHIIPGAPEFPSNLGLIGIPYSQGTTAFANCLVAHEIGHYVYRGTNYQGTSVETAFQSEAAVAIKVALGDEYNKHDEDHRNAMVKVVTQWAEELFCDLFGVTLLGPCYTYAYIEAYELSAVLGSTGVLSKERLLPRLKFHELYPSELFRIQQQSHFLRESAWSDHIKSSAAHYSTLLQALPGITTQDHLKENQNIAGLVSALFAILPEIRKAVGEALGELDNGYSSFHELNSAIKTCLASSVVPSTVNIQTGKKPEDTTTVHPSPLVLLNSGMEFYLVRVNDLIRSIPREDENLYPRRLHWIRRIEEWVGKAIEDEYLTQEAVDGDNIENGN